MEFTFSFTTRQEKARDKKGEKKKKKLTSPRMYPPTNQQIRPRHIRRRLTQQKHHSGRNLLWLPNSPQRRSSLHQLPTSLRRILSRASGLIRLDKRRTHGIYSDVKRGEFGGEDL